MTRKFGLIVSLCIACGKGGSSDGSDESSSSTSGAEESTTSSSTTMAMTTTPPTTTATTSPPDTGEMSTGEPPCTDPFTMGELDRAALYQVEEGADTQFVDIGVILNDRYVAASAAQVAGDIRLATLLIQNINGLEEALLGEGTMDVEVDRLAINATADGSRMITQTDGTTVEIRDPGDFFNVSGTYQEMGARTRFFDATWVGTDLWGVGFAEGMMANYGLVAQSTDGGMTWMMTSTFEIVAGQAAEAHAVAYHANADALVIAALAADADVMPNWHVRAGLIAQPDSTEVLETIVGGNAKAVEVIGDDIYVAGDVMGVWHIRHAPAIGMPFEPFDSGGAGLGMTSTVVDLAQGPNGELFALGTTDTEAGATLMVVRMCADPSMGTDCWQTIVEPEQDFVGESTFPRRMLIDDEGLWIVGSVVDVDEDIGHEGAFFHLGCPD
jgi:hypothetical protein